MDDLPVVVLQEILDFLSIQEKMRSKLICKKFKFVVETFCTQQNVCIYTHDYPYDESWCWSDQRIAEEDMLHLKFDIETSRPFDLRMEFFRNLQKVCLHWIGAVKVDQFLEEVHLLSKLKVLMIDETDRITLRTLSSSSLEKLSLKHCVVGSLELDTPNLSSVTFLTNYAAISFRFPLKVKQLECLTFDPCLNHLNNLESLICERITSDFKLSDFKTLTRLEVFPNNEDDLQVVRQILDLRKRLDRDRPEMFICGFKEQLPTCKKIHTTFDDMEPGVFEYYYGLQPEYIEYAVQNFSNLVGTIPWSFNLDIPTLLKCGNLIPQDFFQKFVRIEQIIYLVIDDLRITESEQRFLIEHIKRSNPRILSIERVDVSSKRDFYEQLSSVQSLGFLWIGPHLENVEFDHFLKLKHLRKFCVTAERISLQFVSKLFVQLKHLVDFSFITPAEVTRLYLDDDLRFEMEIWFDSIGPEEGGPYSPFNLRCHNPDHAVCCNNVNELVQAINGLREDNRFRQWIE